MCVYWRENSITLAEAKERRKENKQTLQINDSWADGFALEYLYTLQMAGKISLL